MINKKNFYTFLTFRGVRGKTLVSFKSLLFVFVQLILHCNKNPIYVLVFWELRRLSPNFHIHVSLSDFYFPAAEQEDQSQEYIKLLTDKSMWKLRLWPRNSFSGNICFQLLVLFLCSVHEHDIFKHCRIKRKVCTK